MPRFFIPILATISIAVLVFAISGRSGDEQTDEPRFPLAQSARSMPEAKVGLEAERAGRPATGESVERNLSKAPECPRKDEDEARVGDFGRPEGVPEYEIIQRSENERGGVCSLRLFVDTRAHDEAGLTLVTRDVKARHAGYDAASIEFTDSSSTLAYTGGAIIFNTTEGALQAGFIYGPPNNRGYLTRAAD